ncbi:MAG: hypothetical protein H5T90_08895, partial [Acetomicrobium sp.]|nr:hypothetical protein [Acetomicrobium sp.]
ISKNRSESRIEEEIARYLRQVEETNLREDELYGLKGRKDEFFTHEERTRQRAKINLTDPEGRIMKTTKGYL